MKKSVVESEQKCFVIAAPLIAVVDVKFVGVAAEIVAGPQL